MTPEVPPLMSLEAITKVYGTGDAEVRALDGVDLAIAEKEFVAIMAALDLPYPKKIDVAVPANKLCGDCPTDLPEMLRQIGGKSEQG